MASIAEQAAFLGAGGKPAPDSPCSEVQRMRESAGSQELAAPAKNTNGRKPYTITKQRERWTDAEHEKFLEALKLHGRAWRRIEEHIGTKTAVQIRSHAQKFFSKLEKEQATGVSSQAGPSDDINFPPPRPKRRPSHPYPRKAAVSSPSSAAPLASAASAGLSGFTQLKGELGEATMAAVAAAASAAAAAAAAAVVAAAGEQVQAQLQAAPPQGFPFFGLPPSALADLGHRQQASLVSMRQALGAMAHMPTSTKQTPEHCSGGEHTGTSELGLESDVTRPFFTDSGSDGDSACFRDGSGKQSAGALGLQANAAVDQKHPLLHHAQRLAAAAPLEAPTVALPHFPWQAGGTDSVALIEALRGGGPTAQAAAAAALASCWGMSGVPQQYQLAGTAALGAFGLPEDRLPAQQHRVHSDRAGRNSRKALRSDSDGSGIKAEVLGKESSSRSGDEKERARMGEAAGAWNRDASSPPAKDADRKDSHDADTSHVVYQGPAAFGQQGSGSGSNPTGDGSSGGGSNGNGETGNGGSSGGSGQHTSGNGRSGKGSNDAAQAEAEALAGNGTSKAPPKQTKTSGAKAVLAEAMATTAEGGVQPSGGHRKHAREPSMQEPVGIPRTAGSGSLDFTLGSLKAAGNMHLLSSFGNLAGSKMSGATATVGQASGVSSGLEEPESSNGGGGKPAESGANAAGLERANSQLDAAAAAMLQNYYDPAAGSAYPYYMHAPNASIAAAAQQQALLQWSSHASPFEVHSLFNHLLGGMFPGTPAAAPPLSQHSLLTAALAQQQAAAAAAPLPSQGPQRPSARHVAPRAGSLPLDGSAAWQSVSPNAKASALAGGLHESILGRGFQPYRTRDAGSPPHYPATGSHKRSGEERGERDPSQLRKRLHTASGAHVAPSC